MKVHLNGLMMKLIPVHLTWYLAPRVPLGFSFVPESQELRKNLCGNCARILIRQRNASLGGSDFVRGFRGSRHETLCGEPGDPAYCRTTGNGIRPSAECRGRVEGRILNRGEPVVPLANFVFPRFFGLSAATANASAHPVRT